jgi:hypothetical protein
MVLDIAFLLNALLLGVMLSFVVVTSPTVFRTLDGEHSKNFLRFIFPRLFNFCAIISGFTSLLFLIGDFSYGVVVSVVIVISFLANTYLLTPQINKMRDLLMAGDETKERSFKYLHLVSVILYLFNMLLAISLFIFI